MNRTLCFLLLFVVSYYAKSQIIYFETGKALTNFNYKDSQGNKLDGLKSRDQNYLGFGLRQPLFQSNWHISVDGTYNRYAAKGSNPTLGNYYEWDATYFGASLAIDYEFLRPPVSYNEQHGFSYYIKIGGSSEFLLNGTQNVNNQINDLAGVEEFDRPLFFARAGVGTNYYISKMFVIFGQYMYGRSFLIGNYANKEQLTFTTHNVCIGLSINLYHRKN